MLVSESCQRRAGGPNAPGRAAAIVLAACVGWACVPLAANGDDRPRDFDPFETIAERQAFEPDVQAEYDPFVTTATGEPAVILLRGELTNEYDPFEAPAPTSEVDVSACKFQESGPALGEAIPAPTTTTSPTPPADGSADAQWVPTPLAALTTSILLPAGVLPRDYSAERPPQALAFWDPCGATRGWPLVGYQWKASAFCHQPLYFEEINLERYGYGCCGCLQYGVSAAHFFGTVPALPYLMAADCPYECDYTLGHYRPGSCPPWRFHWPPCCDTLGTASEAGVITGLIFLIP